MTAGYFDTSFGMKGKAVAAFTGTAGPMLKAEAIAAQTDGKVVEAGTVRYGGLQSVGGKSTSGEIGIARFTLKGKLDTSFGVGGKANLSFMTGNPAASDVVGVAVDALGRIYVAGTGVRANGAPRSSSCGSRRTGSSTRRSASAAGRSRTSTRSAPRA